MFSHRIPPSSQLAAVEGHVVENLVPIVKACKHLVDASDDRDVSLDDTARAAHSLAQHVDDFRRHVDAIRHAARAKRGPPQGGSGSATANGALHSADPHPNPICFLQLASDPVADMVAGGPVGSDGLFHDMPYHHPLDAAVQPGTVPPINAIDRHPCAPYMGAGADVGAGVQRQMLVNQSRGNSPPSHEPMPDPMSATAPLGRWPSRPEGTGSSEHGHHQLGIAAFPNEQAAALGFWAGRAETAAPPSRPSLAALSPNRLESEATSQRESISSAAEAWSAAETGFQSPAMRLHARNPSNGKTPFPLAGNEAVCTPAKVPNTAGSRHSGNQPLGRRKPARASRASIHVSLQRPTTNQTAALDRDHSANVPIEVDSSSASDASSDLLTLDSETTVPSMKAGKRLATEPLPPNRPAKVVRMSLDDPPTHPITWEHRLSRAQAWRAHILFVAEDKGQNGQGLLQALDNAPPFKDFKDVLRGLQCFYEAARPERLIAFRKLLPRAPIEPLPGEPSSTPSDVETLCELHRLIVKSTEDEPRTLRSNALIYLFRYCKNFQSVVASRKEHIATERPLQRQVQYHARKRGMSHIHPTPDGYKRGLTADGQVRADIVRGLRKAGYDPTATEEQVTRHLRIGKFLVLLLGAHISECWLLLVTPQADDIATLLGENQPPILNINGSSPPEVHPRLSRPILSREFFGFTHEFATWFRKYLFVVRPELESISFDGIDIFGGPCRPIPLCSASEEYIYRITPSEVAKLFK